MVRSPRSLSTRPALVPAALLALGLAAAPAALSAAAAAPGARATSELPINLDASKVEIDARSNTLAYTDVTISQGTTRVQADHAHASGLNFANSHWTFEGNVRINAEEHGNLRSDQATVDFRDNHILRATITGKPAQFEQRRSDTNQLARGHADEIVYDVTEGTVRLTDDAWLTDGQREISAPLLVYNVRAQHIQAATTPGNAQRIHIVIPGSGKIETLPADKNPPKPQPEP
jgi:lipopolysaccharide transport protein LptA